MNLSDVATIAAWILIAIGFVAIFLPVAPSIPVIWLGLFVYAMGHAFAVVTKPFMVTVSLIALATVFLDYTLFKFGIRKFRAGAWGVAGALLGFLVGSFINPLAAYLVGPILGAIAFQSLTGRDQVYSFKTGNTTVVAFLGGTVVKLVAALAMIGFFVLRLRGKL